MPVDVRSDIYSLGVVLFELLMGRPPFKSDGSFTFVVYQHVHSSPPALGAMQGTPELPGPLKDLIERCLEKKPERRYQRPEDLLEAIEKARASIDAVGPAAAPAPAAAKVPAVVPPDPLRRRRAWRTAALVAVMLAGAAVAIVAAARFGARRDPEATAQVDLLLGLGDPASALEVARRRWGAGSAECREVEAREAESRRARAELEGIEAVRRHDWEGAEAAFGRAVAGAPAERRRELQPAMDLARDFLRAQSLERQRRIPEAIEIYRRAARRAPPLEPYCRLEAERLEKSALPTAPVR